MPWRLDEFRAKVSFTTSAEMPHLVYRACLATGTVSNTAYYQVAVCERLARDLDIPLDVLLARLPPRRGPAAHVFDPDDHLMARYPVGVHEDQSGGTFQIGPANTREEVR